MLQIVGYLSMLSIIPAALLALGKWKRWILADIKLLVYIVLFRAVANAISFMLFVKKFNHSYFTAAYNILELLLLALYFSAQYKHHHLRKYYLVLVLITAIVFTVELTQSAIFPNMGKTATALSIIILCAIHAYKWLVFDTSKPDGTPRKLMDVSKMTNAGWSAKIVLEEGIKETYQWFLENVGEVKEVRM